MNVPESFQKMTDELIGKWGKAMGLLATSEALDRMWAELKTDIVAEFTAHARTAGQAQTQAWEDATDLIMEFMTEQALNARARKTGLLPATTDELPATNLAETQNWTPRTCTLNQTPESTYPDRDNEPI